MRSAALAGAGCLLLVGAVACGDRDAGSATAPAGTTASQAGNYEAEAPARDEPASDASGGKCGTVERNYSADEIFELQDVDAISAIYDDPELFTTIVAATPDGGQQKYLDDTCARILEETPTVPIEGYVEEIAKQLSQNAAAQAGTIMPGYTACYEMAATGGPLTSGLTIVSVDPADANQNLCPQISFTS